MEKAGYVRFHHWRLDGERGPRDEQVAVWLYAEHLTPVFQDEPLAEHCVAHRPGKRRPQAVTEERLFKTPHRSPQPLL